MLFHPLAANFHPMEVVFCWRDPQLQVSENYSDLTKWRSTNFKFGWLLSLFIISMCKSWYVGLMIVLIKNVKNGYGRHRRLIKGLMRRSLSIFVALDQRPVFAGYCMQSFVWRSTLGEKGSTARRGVFFRSHPGLSLRTRPCIKIRCIKTNMPASLPYCQVTSNKYLLLMVPVWGTWQKSQESAGAI